MAQTAEANSAGTGRRGDPCVMVILGASGDLTRRKLIPALYNLGGHQLLSREFAVVGVAHDGMSTEDFRAQLRQNVQQFAGLKLDRDFEEWFERRMFYITGDFGDRRTFEEMKDLLQKLDTDYATRGNYFFYLAIAPTFFGPVVEQLSAAGLMRETNRHWRRVIVEKPFGRDLDSARALNKQLLKVVEESQIYRIDHYLGKETVQNIMAFRFANGIFEPIWNRRYIDHLQISVTETVGVEQRGAYYDHAGALRDMVPNHMMQLISLTSMEPPISFHADAVRDEQAKILNAIQPLTSEEVLSRTVRGQYGAGEFAGQQVPGYRSETGVPADSRAETYVAIKLQIDNWRWAGVPVYIRTGKRMAARSTDIVIQFRQAPFVLFRETSVENLMPNQLVLHIQPEEGISLRFAAKTPGPVMRLGTVDMDFSYADYFGQEPSTGYERLLHDCMLGDATLFQRADMVEAGWAVVNPILDVWKALPPRSFPNYAAGGWGPKEADTLLEHDERRWRNFER
jgi:glucose-6-phosphate 1-dehydrogenase